MIFLKLVQNFQREYFLFFLCNFNDFGAQSMLYLALVLRELICHRRQSAVVEKPFKKILILAVSLSY